MKETVFSYITYCLDPSREAEPLGEEAVEAVEVDLGTKIELRINATAVRVRVRVASSQYPATVKASHAYENSYDLDYDDGDAESRVPARYVRPLATAAPTPLTTTSRAPPPADLEPEL